MVDQQKKELRIKIRALKNQYTLSEKKSFSKTIFDKIEKREDFQNAKTIVIYWSMNDEVHTHDFIQKWYKHKRIILPTVKGENLVLIEFTGMLNMSEGIAFKILEPKGDEFIDFNEIDILFVPGIAFDKQNNRMGRGKAYYDKTLKKINAMKIGLCFDFQLVESVPVAEHDIKMDLVIYN